MLFSLQHQNFWHPVSNRAKLNRPSIYFHNVAGFSEMGLFQSSQAQMANVYTVLCVHHFRHVLQMGVFGRAPNLTKETVSPIFWVYLFCPGNVFLLNLDVSVVLAFLPMRLIDLEDPETWKLGRHCSLTASSYLNLVFSCFFSKRNGENNTTVIWTVHTQFKPDFSVGNWTQKLSSFNLVHSSDQIEAQVYTWLALQE